MSREQPALDILVGRSQNLCPICWMPLCVGSGPEAEKWKGVQIVFKGKPAFAIRNPKTQTDKSRAVFVFGLNDLAYTNKSNHQWCHYVHYSQFGVVLTVENMWVIGNGGDRGAVPFHYVHRTVNPLLDFYVRICENGMFKEAFRDEAFFKRACQYDAAGPRCDANMRVVANFREELFQRFAGCIDCNSKMTISKFIEKAFDLVFPNTTYAVGARPAGARVKLVSTEEMIHYLLLSGCLRSGDINDGKDDFTVRDPFRLQSWTLRYITMWCLIQILFCKWYISEEGPTLWHHMDYLYVGVMDLYMSVWFYAMHCLGFQEGSAHKISFMEFHYFYSSFIPQQAKSQGEYDGESMNLSLMVMQTDDLSDDLAAWRFPNQDRATDLETMQAQVGDIMGDMMRAWTDSVKPLSDQINAGRLQRPYSDFFIQPADIAAKRDAARDLANARTLSIRSFSQALGARWYWLHFKTVTIRRITALCREYDALLSRNNDSLAGATRVQMWRQWYRRFMALVDSL